jgi:hypothetical protein
MEEKILSKHFCKDVNKMVLDYTKDTVKEIRSKWEIPISEFDTNEVIQNRRYASDLLQHAYDRCVVDNVSDEMTCKILVCMSDYMADEKNNMYSDATQVSLPSMYESEFYDIQYKYVREAVSNSRDVCIKYLEKLKKDKSRDPMLMGTLNRELLLPGCAPARVYLPLAIEGWNDNRYFEGIQNNLRRLGDCKMDYYRMLKNFVEDNRDSNRYRYIIKEDAPTDDKPTQIIKKKKSGGSSFLTGMLLGGLLF